MEGSLVDGKYRILRAIGQGGMGAVYEASHGTTGRRVAIKLIPPERIGKSIESVARFQREARANGTIESPYVVQVLDAGVDAATGSPYMAMEYLAGEDLQQLVERLGPLPAQLVLRIVLQAALGLATAHEAGVVHRDIKAANLFLARRDQSASGELVTKVLDFGVAKLDDPLSDVGDPRLTKTGTMVGSPVYMSPEQAVGSRQLDARSDIFSLGVTMYEALSGRPPHADCESLGALILAICSKPAPPLALSAPWVSPSLAAIVHRMLARDPAQRFASARALHAALSGELDGPPTIQAEMLVALTTASRSARPGPSSASLLETSPAVTTTHTTTTRTSSSIPATVTASSVHGDLRHGATADASARSIPAPPEPEPGGRPIGPSKPLWRRAVLLAFALVVVGAPVGWAVARWRASGWNTAGAIAPTVSIPPPPSAPLPSASGPVAASAPAPSSSAPTDGLPPAVPSAFASPSATSSAPPFLAARPRVAPKGSAPRPRPAASVDPCDPPYVIEPGGRKHFKVDCVAGK